ncbi:hypothetical protein [Dietzia sp. IN118]|jgi:VIT1/CCC1 family predicted Fe2+/Mn2+ transporter|uniref:hypothetical protein n=1 Tax=Dietzia sp. IN118 TaxID=3061631 RepID=UPI00293AA2CD|nr:hypothetical protein [Dietzia sp. IN118]MDV3356844.1 hypothetical protein [Dietzia sp. IN118]
MRNTLMLEERRPDDTGAPHPDVDTTPGVSRVDASSVDAPHATVLPAPLTTIIAALAGGLIGIAAVYGVASRLAGSLTAVAAIVMVFGVTLAGPRVHAAARTELGRTIAVTLQAIGFGGVVGALVIAA